jgi:hypothetical protein
MRARRGARACGGDEIAFATEGGFLCVAITGCYVGEADACPGSDLSETVVMRDVDSGVDNRDRGDGCTIEDLIRDEDEWPSHGRFMRHVQQITDRLVRDGVISRAEQGRILAAAGRSSERKPS